MRDNILYFDFSAPLRKILTGVELYSTPGMIETIFSGSNSLVSFTVERIGENSKFFGFGISHKAEIKLLPDSRPQKNKELKIHFASTHEASFENLYPYPSFKIEEIKKDENTGELTLTAYDKLHAATAHTIAEVDLPTDYVLGEIASACADFLGLSMDFRGDDASIWSTYYPEGANLDGAETLREVLDAIAEVSQTIYYVDDRDNLIFKRIIDAESLTITKADYMTLKSGETRKLTSLTHATELGDNLTEDSGEPGVTQYIRNNPFMELREDIADMLRTALDLVKGTEITQFDLDWRGNPLLEIGDKVQIVDKEGNYLTAYVLDDVVTYGGGLSEKTRWSYEATNETASNSTSLGEVIKQTYAKVDKANKQVDIVVSETGENKASISAIQANIDSISASVTKVQEEAKTNIEGLSEEVSALQTDISNMQLSADNALLEFKRELEVDGVDKVTTSTGYTLDSNGLKITKSNSEINTTITEDGMSIKRHDEEVLVANNEGVKAEDLHATTYLIIGNNSRFEDWGSDRTACFWIGQ